MPDNENRKELISRLQTFTYNYNYQKKMHGKQIRLIEEYNDSLRELQKISNGMPCSNLDYDVICTFALEYSGSLYLQNTYDSLDMPTRIDNGKALLNFLSIPCRPEKEFRIIYDNLYKVLVKLCQFNRKCYLQDNKNDAKIKYFNSLRNIFFKYGLALNLRNAQNFIIIENSLFYIEDSKIYILTPNLIQSFYRNNLPASALTEIMKALFKCNFKNMTEKLQGIQYQLTGNHYGVTYKNKHFSAQPSALPLDYRNKYAAMELIGDFQRINKSLVLTVLTTISLSKMQGFRFWSDLTVCAYTQETRGRLFLIHYKQAAAVAALFEWIELLFNVPCLISSYEFMTEASSLLSYQATCNLLGIINFNDLPLHKYELIIKMANGIAISLPGGTPGWITQYKNTMPLIVLIDNPKDYTHLKELCYKSNIVYRDLELETLESPNLSGNDLLYLKWCLVSGYYHPWHKNTPSLKTECSVLKDFIEKFCTITGEEENQHRSLDFYTNYVVPFFQANHVNEPGYKRFNKLLKTYYDGMIRVLPIHKEKSDNVQHILGLQFNLSQYNNYMKKLDNSVEKVNETFFKYINTIFALAKNDCHDIFAAIEALKNPLQ